MPKLTARSAKWMDSVKANFAAATGTPIEAWVAMAKKAGVAGDAKIARAWLRDEQGFTTVQVSYVLATLFPEPDDDRALLDAQYSGGKAALRPIYDALEDIVRGLGDDVMIAPRKSQVTFARQVTFAVARAATKTRVDLALRLPGTKPGARLVANPRGAGSDPTHVVALAAVAEVDGDVRKWLALAYRHAAR